MNQTSPTPPPSSSSNALSLQWGFGFNKEVVGGVLNLSNSQRNAIFFPSAHTGVIYDFENRTQILLQGHCSTIISCAVSNDKRWIATADSGDEPILVVWDSITGSPVKTIFNPHLDGAISLDFSDDSLFVVSLSSKNDNGKQDVAIWAWTTEDDTPVLIQPVLTSEYQHTLKCNPSKHNEIVTIGAATLCFWNWEEFSLECYVTKASKADIGHYSGKFTSTVFLPDNGMALSSTDEGYIIVWEGTGSNYGSGQSMRSALKVIKLTECGIKIMKIINGYVAMACLDGAVRFFDYFLRLEAWFEDLSAGPITSMSFGDQECPYVKGEAGIPGLKFWTPPFVIGTSEAFIVGVDTSIFDEIRAEDRRGTLLLQGFNDEISGVACHPWRSLVAFTCYNGTLQLWDYEMKILMNLKEFNSGKGKGGGEGGEKGHSIMRPQCIAFERTEGLLAVGFTSGHIRFLNVDTLEDTASYVPSSETVLQLKFSPSGDYLASFDSSNRVFVFRRVRDKNTARSEYVYIGRVLSHSGSITGLEFGYREGLETLYSIGQDRKIVEYDLQSSSVENGVMCYRDSQYLAKIETTARPTAICWNPLSPGDVEERVIICSDEFKFREVSADSKQCRRTLRAPTFGGPIVCMIPIPIANTNTNTNTNTNSNTATNKSHYIYSTASKVIGMGRFPLTGNPLDVMGIVAHPGCISGIALSHDGRFLFSTGGGDLAACMWTVVTSSNGLGDDDDDEGGLRGLKGGLKGGLRGLGSGDDMESFLNLLEGGADGEVYNDIKDYFYYCQIRADGEDNMAVRNLTGRIPLEEIPSLVRAIGYYPTEEEVGNMISEVRYGSFMITGELVNDIDMSTFIRLYLNHRPVLPLNGQQVLESFQCICNSISNGNGNGNEIRWDDLKALLMSTGEALSSSDMQAVITALVGADSKFLDDSVVFDAATFANQILGFEDLAN